MKDTAVVTARPVGRHNLDAGAAKKMDAKKPVSPAARAADGAPSILRLESRFPEVIQWPERLRTRLT